MLYLYLTRDEAERRAYIDNRPELAAIIALLPRTEKVKYPLP